MSFKYKRITRRVPQGPGSLSGADVPPFLQRIYLARGIKTAQDLELKLQFLADNGALRGLSDAIALLVSALEQAQHILVVGDFDADGATSTALMISALRAMGARCDYLVPNRFEYGYGLTPEIVELAAQQSPDLIVTVDNGISSIEGVEKAQSLGIKVLVTDHHLPGAQLPQADAIVNPNQPGCEFMSKHAAGVGVAFYVLSSLRTHLKQNDWFSRRGIPEVNMADFLDLVALGTVADLVPLDRNNRILVEQGLRRMRAGRCRPGILALLAVAQKDYRNVSSTDLGFILGPRLNAAGRLDDMSLGIECLLCDDPLEARHLAQQLDSLNRQRKSIEEEMKRDAEQQIAQLKDIEAGDRWGVCLFDEQWHQGVIGILASRVKERLHRPTIVFAPANSEALGEDDIVKGSARSIKGLHMRDALDLVAKRAPDLLQKFGGHAMAAGMTIARKNLSAFSEAFDAVVKECLAEEDLEAVLYSDGPLDDDELAMPSIELLQRAGPWGQQFPEPCFDDEFHVVQSKVLKERHLKLVLSRAQTGQLYDTIQFNSDWAHQPAPG
ncbi:MAG: single-stranded-DNA-specific exonuclease RecJ, partial [Oleiphilaceae bacterium]|nr:single-stranded-DNA-specific exonuclease RecJ [Oleiphilaceae bacterium]